jgi:hypothetical protein
MLVNLRDYRIVALLLIWTFSSNCIAEKLSLTQLIGKNIRSDGDVVTLFKPVVEMSRSETWVEEPSVEHKRVVKVYRTSYDWLKLITNPENGREDIVLVSVLCDKLPAQEVSLGDIELPFRYDQISSCNTLISYYSLPLNILRNSNKIVAYGLSGHYGSITIYADQLTVTNVQEIIFSSQLCGIRDIPSHAKYRSQIQYLKTTLPSFKFRRESEYDAPDFKTNGYSLINILGSPVVNETIRLNNGEVLNMTQRRKVVFNDYDLKGSATSRVQFVEYAMSNQWLKVLSIAEGSNKEIIFQCTVAVEKYLKDGMELFRLPRSVQWYRSPNSMDGEKWLVCPTQWTYDICVKDDSILLWLSFARKEIAEVFGLETLSFSKGDVSARYGVYSPYIYRSSWRLLPLFKIPSACREAERPLIHDH